MISAAELTVIDADRRCSRWRTSPTKTGSQTSRMQSRAPSRLTAQHEDLPEVHARASGGLFASEDLAFEQSEDLSLERGMHPDPLQAREDGRQFVAALERQTNLFDGRDLKIGLVLEVVAHGVEQWRMLQVQTSKSPHSFNHTPNIRTPTNEQCSMPAHSFALNAAH